MGIRKRLEYFILFSFLLFLLSCSPLHIFISCFRLEKKYLGKRKDTENFWLAVVFTNPLNHALSLSLVMKYFAYSSTDVFGKKASHTGESLYSYYQYGTSSLRNNSFYIPSWQRIPKTLFRRRRRAGGAEPRPPRRRQRRVPPPAQEVGTLLLQVSKHQVSGSFL